MKFIIRTFFKTLRLVLGPVMLLRERLSRPVGLVRPPEAQALVDQECRSLALYQFTTCPFCIKVRQEMRRLSLDIERRDAQHDVKNREELGRAGGQVKVPCLKITDASGSSQWLYESGAIISYLQGRFAAV
ncbi:MAG: glutaredoxin [Rhodoferax sp.]|uniref:glutaredoxin family protein n=1 Tax=Rhodoferax sp. TaxID=50421 RepID=UPI0013FFAAAC|nr:glutathione S-transferase N-terminal domain-containing protein [Rhodoferax sp.]NDP37701.1 glutaredoxin [Rhodoferax sp.]